MRKPACLLTVRIWPPIMYFRHCGIRALVVDFWHCVICIPLSVSFVIRPGVGCSSRLFVLILMEIVCSGACGVSSIWLDVTSVFVVATVAVVPVLPIPCDPRVVVGIVSGLRMVISGLE